MKKRNRIIVVSIVLVALLATAFLFRVKIRDAADNFSKPDLPEPKAAQDFTPPPQPPATPPTSPTPVTSSASINLAVPFGSQAPFGNWSMPYQEACEEASMIMVDSFYSGETLTPAIMDSKILEVVEWQNQNLGHYEDTNSLEMERILKEYFKRENVEILHEFTVDDIKKNLSKGYPVIMLLAGRELYNPYFTPPGPVFHVLVVKGFVNDKLITHDPGTRRGQDYLYDPEVLMNATHDWSSPDIDQGKPTIIIVKP